MKNIIAIAVLMLASNPLWAESLKPLDLNGAGLQAVRSVQLPEIKLSPAPAVTRESWKHVKLYTADGTVITVDYSIMTRGNTIFAAPVWVNVVNRAFGSYNKVRVVLMNYYDNQGGPSGIQETQQIDLAHAGGTRYTAQAKDVPLSMSFTGYGYNFRQEIAVVVDGRWMTTTDGKSNNFGFKMTWY